MIDTSIYHRECFTFVSIARKKGKEKRKKEKFSKKCLQSPGKKRKELCVDANAQGIMNHSYGTFEALAIPSPMVTQSQKECQ